MIGRTNITRSLGSSGVTMVDLPTHLKTLSTAVSNGRVDISLEYSDTDFVSGVDIVYKTGSYPKSPADGDCTTAEGAVTSIPITGLTNNTTYFFRVYLYHLIDGVKYYQTDETNAKISAIPSIVGISGVTPAVRGDNYLLIDESGTFLLDVPEGITTVTAYLVGGGANGGCFYDSADDESTDYSGGDGGRGGYVHTFVLPTASYTQEFTCAVGSIESVTTLLNGGQTFSSSSGTYVSGGAGVNGKYTLYGGSGKDGVLTPYGYVGSSGGGGGVRAGSVKAVGGGGGKGAGNGGYYTSTSSAVGTDATNYGCGGGGASGYHDTYSNTAGGAGMQGCIIIEWA